MSTNDSGHQCPPSGGNNRRNRHRQIGRVPRTLTIKEHGERADLYAAMRADELLEAGDMDGRGVWLRVLKAVEELSSKEPPKGTALH